MRQAIKLHYTCDHEGCAAMLEVWEGADDFGDWTIDEDALHRFGDWCPEHKPWGEKDERGAVSCPQCCALVSWHHIPNHDEWHKKLSNG